MSKKSNKKPFILVDGSSYLFRAFFALPPLTNKSGQPTGAIYGVINMLRRLVADYEPEHIAVVFDPKGKTFRHEKYEAYKANRAEMPDDLRVQIEPLHHVIRALGLPLVIKDGVEADDVIGTLAVQAEQQGMPVLISTGDKDMAQLVNKEVTLINTMTNKMMDEAGVVEKFGVRPDQIIDYLTLIGDTSDNVPGVPKVGPKTAAKWIGQYGSLDAIIESADEIKGKVGENLRNHLPHIPLARELVTIKLDVPLSEGPDTLNIKSPDTEKLTEYFTEFEFKNWLKELQVKQAPTAKPAAYQTIYKKSELDQLIKKIKAKKRFAFDTETTSIEAMNAELVGISIAIEGESAVYIPLAHDYDGAPKQLAREDVLKALTPIFQDPTVLLIAQNAKYDLEVLHHYGISIKAQLLDTMIESYVLNSSGSRHDMDTLAAKYLGRTTIKFEDVAGKGVKQKTFNQIEIDVAADYAAEDADITLALADKLTEELDQIPELKKVYDEIDLPLVPVLARMEQYGVLIDQAMLAKQSKQLASRVAELQQQAYDIAEEEFNLASPKQLQQILFEKLKLPILKKTPGGQPSTAEGVLQDLSLDYPLPKIILEYRSLAKLKSTYTDKLPEQVNAKTGRVHTSYNQAVTATGRLSSNNPNLQNIPIRTEEGRKIRKAFIAAPGCKMIAADYSQIELRIIAHVSQDPGLLKAFKNNWDVHRATAAEVFGVSLDEVSDEQRRHAKTINFGLLYGMSAFGLSKNLNISRADAQNYMDVYFERYPKVHEYMETTCEFARQHGYVETLYGRRIHVPDINASNGMRKKAAERAAINAPMQGSSADIIKMAMLCVDDWIAQSGLDLHMIMQVHDELILEVKDADVEEAKKHLKQCMEGAAQLSVPLIVDVGIGDNWDEAH